MDHLRTATDMSARVPAPLLSIEGLSKAFGTHRVVDDVRLEIAAGEIFGLIGPNGAGKSTLIKMLTTLLPPTSGTARIAGYDITRDSRAVRALIGYVPQLLSADGALTGRENLLLSSRLYLIPGAERGTRIAEALAMTGLAEAADRQAQHYSGGMLRRLEIAQSTLHRPLLLIMDEPTVGLDPVARDAIWDHIRNLRERFGTTILVTTHLMDEVEALCDRIGVLHRGRLEKVGSAESLKAEIGPGATLDDVFTRIAGGDIEQGGDYGNVRQSRLSARAHG
ncbi:ABC transporter ATP-binding protein [Labrys miyagiensis]